MSCDNVNPKVEVPLKFLPRDSVPNPMYIKCPYCRKRQQYQYVGSHWKLTCLNPDCQGRCEIIGKTMKDIENKLKKEKK